MINFSFDILLYDDWKIKKKDVEETWASLFVIRTFWLWEE